MAGDSVKSVLSDLSFCGLGYFISALFLSLEMIWLSGLWIAASEVSISPDLSLFPLLTVYSGGVYTVVQRQPGADTGQYVGTQGGQLGGQQGARTSQYYLLLLAQLSQDKINHPAITCHMSPILIYSKLLRCTGDLPLSA